jgi:hypothetical protein
MKDTDHKLTNKVIRLKDRSGGPPDNLIVSTPWEFRRSDWESLHFIQMLKSQSARLEAHRREIYWKGGSGIWHLPSHFTLKGGMAYTIQGMYAYRNDGDKMKEVYYLTGLVDCMINQSNPILRTDLIRDLYKRVMDLRNALKVSWCGPLDQVLFPLDVQFHNEIEYREKLSTARTMKTLYQRIRESTREMFDILSLEYVFYTPGRRP